jgi:MATE family multidrug resistance protein
LQWTQVPIEVQGDVKAYLAILAAALPAALFFRLYSSLNQSIGKPRLVTWIQIAALGAKIPLSILFTFGAGPIQGMGILGCALATVLVSYAMCALALWLLLTKALYEPLAIWQPMSKPQWSTLAQMARLGIPNGLSVLVEVTSFTLMALFIARLGTVATASHQIAANMTALLYMVPLSFSIAISARVSYWIGAKQVAEMRKVLRIGFEFIALEALFFALILLTLSSPISALYARDVAVAQSAAELLMIVGLYHVGDAIQTLCFFVLRSFKVTLLPFLVYGSMLWGVGLTGGYLLAYHGLANLKAMQSPAAFWMMSVVALLLVCVGLIGLIRRELSGRFAS